MESTSAGFCNVLSGDLGYMKQSVYARLKLNECAEVSHTSYLTGNYVAYCVLLSSVQPTDLSPGTSWKGQSSHR